MINIENYRELLLKLFCMELKLRKCFFLQKFNVRKLSLFGRSKYHFRFTLTGRGRFSTGRGVCHGVVGVITDHMTFRGVHRGGACAACTPLFEKRRVRRTPLFFAPPFYFRTPPPFFRCPPNPYHVPS